MYVDIYLNLHKTKEMGCLVYSVKNKKINRVCKHLTGNFFVKNAKFVVSKKGRERVIKSGVKNVHAFVRGNLEQNLIPHREASVIYNPYLYTSFVDSISKKKVESSALAFFDHDGKIYYL